MSPCCSKSDTSYTSITFLMHYSHIGCSLPKKRFILQHFYLYSWPELGLSGFSWLLSIFPIVQWRRGCCTAFLVPCQSLSQFTFKASAQLSTPVVKPTLSIHIVSVKMKICISTEFPKKQHVAPAFSLMSLGGLGSDVTSVKQEVSFFFQALNKECENLLCARE